MQIRNKLSFAACGVLAVGMMLSLESCISETSNEGVVIIGNGADDSQKSILALNAEGPRMEETFVVDELGIRPFLTDEKKAMSSETAWIPTAAEAPSVNIEWLAGAAADSYVFKIQDRVSLELPEGEEVNPCQFFRKNVNTGELTCEAKLEKIGAKRLVAEPKYMHDGSFYNLEAQKQLTYRRVDGKKFAIAERVDEFYLEHAGNLFLRRGTQWTWISTTDLRKWNGEKRLVETILPNPIYLFQNSALEVRYIRRGEIFGFNNAAEKFEPLNKITNEQVPFVQNVELKPVGRDKGGVFIVTQSENLGTPSRLLRLSDEGLEVIREGGTAIPRRMMVGGPDASRYLLVSDEGELTVAETCGRKEDARWVCELAKVNQPNLKDAVVWKEHILAIFQRDLDLVATLTKIKSSDEAIEEPKEFVLENGRFKELRLFHTFPAWEKAETPVKNL